MKVEFVANGIRYSFEWNRPPLTLDKIKPDKSLWTYAQQKRVALGVWRREGLHRQSNKGVVAE